MKRMILAIVAVAALTMGVTTGAAYAYTKGQAELAAEEYAATHFIEGEAHVAGCDASGKNKAGEAQWYCWGYFGSGTEWKVNVGPYGEITYARE